MGKAQIDQALKHEPSAVFALDFLFWYLYGNVKGGDESRLDLFEKGLAQLDRFKCPIVLGDIPNVEKAVGRVLSKSQMPTIAILEKANTRLLQWAKERDQVKILPLSYFITQVEANEEIKIAGYHLPKGKTGTLLQRDRLHPNEAGVKALVQASLALLK